jgi:signal peptidase II
VVEVVRLQSTRLSRPTTRLERFCGALWGIGQNQTWLFAALSFVAIVVIAYFLWSKQAIASWWLTIATGLLFAGTLGNLYDRLSLHGWKDEGSPVYAVRDFLDFVFFDGAFNWATFNFADVFLVTGAIMLVLQSFSGSRDETGAKPSQSVPQA